MVAMNGFISILRLIHKFRKNVFALQASQTQITEYVSFSSPPLPDDYLNITFNFRHAFSLNTFFSFFYVSMLSLLSSSVTKSFRQCVSWSVRRLVDCKAFCSETSLYVYTAFSHFTSRWLTLQVVGLTLRCLTHGPLWFKLCAYR